MNGETMHPTPLPAGWYRDPDPFQAERRGLFAPNWMMLAPIASLAGDGAYVCSNIGGWPLFAWRETGGDLRVFHNVCRHQKMPMLQAGAGSLEELRCPFHGWVYRQDGSLKHAPPPEEPDVDDLSTIVLNGMVRSEWRGLIMVGVDADNPPRDLGASLAPLDGLMPDLSAGWEQAGTDSVDLICNWKTWLDFGDALATPNGGAGSAVAGESPAPGIAVVDGIGGGTWLWAWPTLGVHVADDVVAVSQLVPRTMIRSRLDRHVFVRAGADGAVALDAWKAVGAAQKAASESAHKALADSKDADASTAPPTPSPAPFGLHDTVRGLLNS